MSSNRELKREFKKAVEGRNLDPVRARQAWEVIQGLIADGKGKANTDAKRLVPVGIAAVI